MSSTTAGISSLGTSFVSSAITISSLGGNINTSNTSGIYTIQKSKYNILGREVEIDGYQDANTALFISIINVLGIEIYVELIKNSISFPSKIKEILDEEVVSSNRNKTIENILN